MGIDQRVVGGRGFLDREAGRRHNGRGPVPDRRPRPPCRIGDHQADALVGKSHERDEEEQYEGDGIVPVRFEVLGAPDVTPDSSHQHAEQDHGSGNVHHQFVTQIPAVAREGDDPRDEEFHIEDVDGRAEHLDSHAPEDHEVHYAGIDFLEDAHLTEDMDEEIFHTR